MLKTTWLAKKLLLSIVENAEIGSGGGDHKDKIVKSLLFKNLNKTTDYLILNAK